MKKLIIVLGIIFGILIGSFVVLFLVIDHKARKLPDNNPVYYVEEVKPDSKNRVLVCIGDSITHGRVSYNYVDILAERFEDMGIDVVNAGINSEHAYNVVLRLDEVIACEPDFVTVLIGTNDAFSEAEFSRERADTKIEEMGLPVAPTEAFFRENLTEICKRLKSETDADVVLMTLPPIGEKIGDKAYSQSDRYSEIIIEVAREEGLKYLPLHESMTEYLEDKGQTPGVIYGEDDFKYLMYKGILFHHVFGKSYDEISASNGLLLVTDYLHLNGTGANMVADMIEGFVLGK